MNSNTVLHSNKEAIQMFKSRTYKKHLKAIAEGMAGRHHIQIKFIESGDDLGYTDGKTICVNLLPSCLMNNTVKDVMCAHIALIVHEHSHQLYSSWDIIRKVAGNELLRDINNILEDGRIERISAFKVPGWSPSLFRLNEMISEIQTAQHDPDKATDFQFLYFWLWEYSKVGHTPNKFPNEAVKKAWKEIKIETLKARYSDTPEPCYEASLKIEEILLRFKKKEPTPQMSDFIRAFNSNSAQGKNAQTGQQMPQQSGSGQGQQSGSQQSQGQQTIISSGSSGSGSSQMQSSQQSSSSSGSSGSSSESYKGTSQEQASGGGGSSSTSNEQNNQNNDTNGSTGSSSSSHNEDENSKKSNSSSGGSDSDKNEEKSDMDLKSDDANNSNEEKGADGEKNDKSDKSENSSDNSENGEKQDSDSKGKDADNSDEKKDSDNGSENPDKADDSDKESDKEGKDGKESDENSKSEGSDKEGANNESDDEEENDLNDLNKGLDDFLDRLDDELDSTAEDYEDEKEAEQKDNGFANTVPAYNRTSYDEHMEERYNERKKRLAGLISNMKTKLFKTIHFNMDETTRKLTRGKVDGKSLCNVINGRICAQRKEKSDETDLNVTFLLDKSGSMDGYLETNTIDATIVVGEALEMLKIPYSILAFANSVHLYKEWRQSKARKYALMNYSPSGGTALDSGLSVVTDMMKKQFRYDKIVFVITDGDPNSVDYAVRQAEILRNTKAQVYGIAIGEIARNSPSRKNFIKIFGDKFYIPCANLEDLPLQLTKVVRKNLLR